MNNIRTLSPALKELKCRKRQMNKHSVVFSERGLHCLCCDLRLYFLTY